MQQWLDVILGYDLTIKYRPGILHIIPDALSRMYMHSYKDNEAVWGTHTNIHFIESSYKSLSPSDFLCQQSISQVKPPTNIKKRYIDDNESGEGDQRQISTQIQNHSNTSSINLVMSIDNPPSLYQYDNNDDYYEFHDNNNENNQEEYDEDEYYLSNQYGSLCYASSYPYMKSPTPITSYDTPYSYIIQEEKNNENNNNNMNIEQDISKSSSSSKEETNNNNNDNNKLTNEERLLLALDRRGVKFTPEDKREEILNRVHLMGHQGIRAMYKMTQQLGYWWPNLYQDIEKIVKNCDSCLKYTIGKHGYHPHQPVTAILPGDHYIMDIMELPESSDGLTHLLVIVDVFTGFIMLRVLLDLETETIARAIWDILCTIGPCKILQHDQAPQFMNNIMKALLNLTGIENRVISAYHPQGDGKVERSIQTIRDILNKSLKGTHELWPLFIPFTQLSYNYRIAELTGSSPFSLMFGRNINELIDYTNYPINNHIDLNNWKQHQLQLISIIFPATTLRSKRIQQKHIDMFNKYRKAILARELPPGSQVMIKDPEYIKNPSSRPKDEARYIGPYYVHHRSIHGPYHLVDRAGVTYERPVHIDQMKVIYRKDVRNPEDENNIYQMDYIVKDRINHQTNKKQYLIKWTGYSHKDNTWEDAENITDRKTIKKYERKKAGLPFTELSSHLYLISSTSDNEMDLP